jgi:hypothetical protein
MAERLALHKTVLPKHSVAQTVAVVLRWVSQAARVHGVTGAAAAQHACKQHSTRWLSQQLTVAWHAHTQVELCAASHAAVAVALCWIPALWTAQVHGAIGAAAVQLACSCQHTV